MSRDIDDLLGDGPSEGPGSRGGSEATVARKKARAARKAPAAEKKVPDMAVIQALHQPVSLGLLSDVMGMTRDTVRRRLVELPPMGQRTGNNPVYDFRQAMNYLVTPRVDVAKVISTMSAGDLPPSLQKDVWDARLKAQKWMLNAGELWPTEDVLEVLGEAFQRLKTTAQLWIDQIGDSHSLPAPARKELAGLVDTLQADLHKTLIEMPKDKATRSMVAELDEDDGAT